MAYLGVKPAGITSATEAEIVGDLTVDTNTLHVDAANNRVGIGQASPTSQLTIGGNANTTAKPTVQVTDTTNGASLTLRGQSPKLSFDITSSGVPTVLLDGAGIEFKDGTLDAEGNVDVKLSGGGVFMVGKSGNDLTLDGLAVLPDDYMTYTNTQTGSSARCLLLNRQSADGRLVEFRQANIVEGNISVSGSTVSYNGGHLARWSQLDDGSKDTAIVKGTVMTNLDQMATWTHAATDDEAEWSEDNEQLNCMAVSSVEGDANVAGVFVNWDDDEDGFNDMNIAMTGDMVIRIAQGTTVARGDLLMSAGDGTAKPQGDDIVRSKTIAKVTSTTVSHTYDDGSYLVPCVLMAC